MESTKIFSVRYSGRRTDETNRLNLNDLGRSLIGLEKIVASGAWLFAFNAEPPKRRSSHPAFSIEAAVPRRGSYELDVVLAQGLTTSALLLNDFTRELGSRLFALWTEYVTNKAIKRVVDDTLFERQSQFNEQMLNSQRELVEILMNSQDTLVERLSEQQREILDNRLEEMNLIFKNEESQRRHVERVIDRTISRQQNSVVEFLTPLRRRSVDSMDISSEKGVYTLHEHDIRRRRRPRSRPERSMEEIQIRIDGFVSMNDKRLRVVPQNLTDEIVVAHVKDSMIHNEFSTNGYLQAFVTNTQLLVIGEVVRDQVGTIKHIDIFEIVRGPAAA